MQHMASDKHAMRSDTVTSSEQQRKFAGRCTQRQEERSQMRRYSSRLDRAMGEECNDTLGAADGGKKK